MLTYCNKTQKLNNNLNIFCPSLIVKIVSYLNQEELINLSNALKNISKYESMQNIIKTKIALIKYLNKADRSYYFTVFDSPTYAKYEDAKLSNLALQQNSSLFYQFPNKFTQILNACQMCVHEDIREQFGEKLTNIFIDPCLPTPKLLRETVAASVSSPFQSFLIEKSICQTDCGDNIYQEVFQIVKQKLQQQQQSYIRQMINNFRVINETRNLAHLIDTKIAQSNKIEGNDFHNLVLNLFALTDLQLNFVKQYLGSIQDPFELLLQLTLRYIQFNNTVIAIEQNLGFLFETYGQLYNEIFAKQSGKFSYWKSAFVMWISKMNCFHDVTNKVYASLMQNQNNQHLLKTLKNEKYVQIYSKLMLNVAMIQQQQQYKNFVYEAMNNEDDSEVKILINSYKQYLVDISIDQNTVHQCGHSKQQLDQIFYDSEKLLIEQQRKFVKLLKKCQFRDDEQILVKQVLKKRISHCQRYVKPSTLKAYINLYNKDQFAEQNVKIDAKDKMVQKYICYYAKNKSNNLNKSGKSLYTIATNSQEKTLADTTQSLNSEYSLQFYDSENQMDEQYSDLIGDIQIEGN